MRVFTSILIYFLLLASSLAQDLEIQILSDANEPIVNAHIEIKNAQDSIFGISDYNGNFKFPKTSFPLFISVQHISFQTKQLKINDPFPFLELRMIRKKGELNEVVITGQAQEIFAKDAIKKMRVINRQRIDDLAAVSLKDLLTNELNIQLSEDPILGSQMTLGGLGGQKIKILIDGVAVIGRLDGNIDLNQINLNNIERVEIVEGPMSVQYGTDALAGTINLISKKHYKTKPEIQLNSFTESVGRYNFDAALNLPIKKTKFNLGLGRNFFQGFDLEDKRDLQWNPKQQYFFQFGLQRKFGNTLISYSTNYIDEKISNRGDVGSIDSLVIPVKDSTGAFKFPRALDDFYYSKRLDNVLRVQHFFLENQVLKFHLAHNFYQRAKISKVINLNTLESTNFGGIDAQDTSVFGTINSRAFFEDQIQKLSLKYQVGFDINHEKIRGERIVEGRQSILDVAFFAALNFKLFDDLNIQPGLRYAYNSRYKSPLISSLALKYELNKKWVFRASYGKGFRSPTLKEMFFFFVDENHNILGNEDLKAESSDNFQLNFDFAQAFANWNFDFSSSLFFNSVKNEIRLFSVLEPNNSDPRGLYTNVNIAESKTTGLNVLAKIRFGAWKTEIGTAVTGIKNDLSSSVDANNINEDLFLFFPQYRFNLSYNFPKINLTSSLFMTHTGKRENLLLDSEGNPIQITFEAYSQSDFTLSKSFYKERLKFTSGIKNIFDISQIQSSSSAGGAHNGGNGTIAFSYGRSYFLRMQFNF